MREPQIKLSTGGEQEENGYLCCCIVSISECSFPILLVKYESAVLWSMPMAASNPIHLRQSIDDRA